jgi:hypothetical protein
MRDKDRILYAIASKRHSDKRRLFKLKETLVCIRVRDRKRRLSITGDFID